MEKLTAKDCRSCGVCCVCSQDQGEYCDVTETDIERLSPAFVRRNVHFHSTFDRLFAAIGGSERTGAIATHWVEVRTGPLRSYELNACVALRGSIMHRVSCSIYECRPAVCKSAVKPGDRSCKELRRAFFQTIERLKEERDG